MDINAKLKEIVSDQPYPLLFATISGAHLYGFPSPDSDYDLRGVHILPPDEVMGLSKPRETIECFHHPAAGDDLDLDLVTHDIRSFMWLMLKRNGNVLEQLYSPLTVHTTPEFEELKRLGEGCITRHHAYHYLGFSQTQWKLFSSENAPRVKPLLYVYRILLTGIHLMRTGEIQANLRNLNETFRLSYIDDLIASKVEGEEKQKLASTDLSFFESEYNRLTAELETARDRSTLPEEHTAKPLLNELLLEVRKRYHV